MPSNLAPDSDHFLACLGVGEGWPSGSRRHASFVYRFGPTQLLVDCGDGMSSAYQAAGFDYDALDAVLLSHMHSDHVGGFSMFVQSLWLNQRRRPLPIFAPERALPALEAWLEATVLPPGLIGFDIEWRAWKAGQSVQLGSVTVTAHPNTHLESLRRSLEAQHPTIAFEAFSFVFEDSSRRVGHSADIGQVTDLEPLLMVRPNFLVSELSHIGVGELAAAVRRVRPERIVFVHVARELLATLDQLKERLREELDGIPFDLARDDDVFLF